MIDLNLKVLAAVAAVIAIAVIGSLYYFIVIRHPATQPSSSTSLGQLLSAKPGAVNSSELSSLLGGNWTMLGNSSFVAVVNLKKGQLDVGYLNGTSKTLNLSNGLELIGPTGQANGGYPLWVTGYFYYSKVSPNTTYQLGIEVFRATNSTQINWTMSAVEGHFNIAPQTADGITYVVVQPYAPVYNITFVYASYRSTYLIIVISLSNASKGQLVQVTAAAAKSIG
ncbi:hypothetical protein ASAC_0884 [Acidilobus saccharovorans 345-15]|uniref:Uncharacterized protein n=1 Tax=Acidilobus saccharovorans (strain DSM 16705 / JCM 18335 / VKM B-2471 / 345-15) TaxID=666510 RepID=D9Q1V2_ACIS3|nr:hypothetical protein [Acidilobus saccharovorans]ADL19290.1 hypothetical protein ASAC_0884 [Acidilobus saccharovorans 345-15]